MINKDRNLNLNSNIAFLAAVIGIGIFLRLINLEGKSPWVDEFATIIFSLGNSFSVPIDRTISFQELVTPLVPNPSATISDTIRLIFAEDQHPPLYFIISHLWLKLFPTQQGLVNLWGSRALSLIFGVISIPVIYIASYLIFRSNLIARSTSLMIALSPYGIYLAQEARHYSLAVIWAIISLACFVLTCQYLVHQKRLPILLAIVWILSNNLGTATHYFFLLVIGGESIGLCLFTFYYLRDNRERRKIDVVNISRLAIVAIFTAIGSAIWLKLYYDSVIPGLTSWMNVRINSPLDLVDPLVRIIVYSLTIFCVLLAELSNKLLAVASVLIMLPFLLWLIVISYRNIIDQWKYVSLQYRSGIVAIVSFCIGAIGIFLIFPVLVKMDITLAPRYQFVYFPAIIFLAGVSIAKCWEVDERTILWLSGKRSVLLISTMAILGSLIIALNQAYYKPYAPEELVSSIEKSAPTPTLIAITHNSLTQSGALMTIAWEMQQVRHSKSTTSTHFLLAHQNELKCLTTDCPATSILRNEIDKLSTPTDLWLVNFFAPLNLPDTCSIDRQTVHQVAGYEYKLYHCKNI